MREVTKVSQYIAIISAVGASILLSSCATKQVQQKLDTKLSTQGVSYARELTAQSPFKKVELSWNEARELMKVRNLKYRQSILDKEQAKREESVVKSFTSELRKNLTDTVQTSLSPTEIASVLKSPIASVPKQFESLTNLKNVSHSMTTKEWSRVSLAIRAETSSREEKVKLHKLFTEHQLLAEKSKILSKYEAMLKKESATDENKALDESLTKHSEIHKKQRLAWLNRVRDFFDAEYFDVDFTKYKRSLPLYRNTKNPQFSDHKRWMLLDHSQELVTDLKADHKDAKPELPGVGMLKSRLSTDALARASEKLDLIANQSKEQERMRKEVRTMIKNWRTLKMLQESLTAKEAEQHGGETLPEKEITLANQIYELKIKELNIASKFWTKDEKCWKDSVIY